MSNMCPLGTLCHLIFSLESGYNVCGTFQFDYHAIDDQISYVTMPVSMYSPLYRKSLKTRQNCCIAPYTADTPCPTGLYSYTACTACTYTAQPRYTFYSLYTIQPYTPTLCVRSSSTVPPAGRGRAQHEIRYDSYTYVC